MSCFINKISRKFIAINYYNICKVILLLYFRMTREVKLASDACVKPFLKLRGMSGPCTSSLMGISLSIIVAPLRHKLPCFFFQQFFYVCELSVNAHTHCLLLNHQLPIQHPFMSADTVTKPLLKVISHWPAVLSLSRPIGISKKQDDYCLFVKERKLVWIICKSFRLIYTSQQDLFFCLP